MGFPSNIILMMIICICILKVVWISIDPFLVNGFFIHRSFERYLAELVYSFIYGIFAVILIVWYTIYVDIANIYNATWKRILCR